MTQQEYLDRLEAIEQEAQAKRTNLRYDYIKEVNPYHGGEIIEDKVGKGIIEATGLYFDVGDRREHPLPQIRYFCTELTKRGTPRKDGSKRWIYYCNILNPRPLKYGNEER